MFLYNFANNNLDRSVLLNTIQFKVQSINTRINNIFFIENTNKKIMNYSPANILIFGK